jgi:hypothetical protein
MYITIRRYKFPPLQRNIPEKENFIFSSVSDTTKEPCEFVDYVFTFL